MEDEAQHFRGKVALKAVLERGGEVLLMRNRGRDTWELPGGRLHTSETPEVGLARELREEFGVDSVVGAPVTTGTFTLGRTGEPHFWVAYRCMLTDPGQVLSLDPREVEEARWIGKEALAGLPVWDDYRQALEIFFKMSDN